MEYDQSDWIILNSLSSSLDHYKKRYDVGLDYFFCYWCSSRAKIYWRLRHRHLGRASRCCVLQTDGYGVKRKTTWVASQNVLKAMKWSLTFSTLYLRILVFSTSFYVIIKHQSKNRCIIRVGNWNYNWHDGFWDS
jgi:hypothetical protein